jgi:lipopolysaccharide transport system ATP-binding protein
MAPDIVISARNLTKAYRLFGHPGDRVKQFLSFGLKRYHREFTALRNVSFDVRRGEMLGIVGRNGSGKSTLLQLVCGILKPSEGSLSVTGRISALLELGAGFNPEFTGRENAYFQGALMGLSGKQMDERYGDISAFADIGEFIDQPVRTYSSGMFLRLAFAVAVHVDPEILVVDEALAVGDAGFRARCFRRIGDLRNAGCTILFVSHDMEQVARLCGRAILLDEGEQLLSGPPESIIVQYRRLLNAGPDTRQAARERIRSQAGGHADNAGIMAEVYDEEGAGEAEAHIAVAYEPNGALIEDVQLVDTAGRSVTVLRTGQDCRCLFRVRFVADARHVRCAMLIKTLDGTRLGGAWTAPSAEAGMAQVADGETVVAQFDFKCALNPGTYLISVAAFGSQAGIEYALHGQQNALRFRVEAESEHTGIGAVGFSCQSAARLAGKAAA